MSFAGLPDGATLIDESSIPTKYDDSFWIAKAKKAEENEGLPAGSLQGVLYGERTNHGETNSHGTYSPFQITKSTRDLILDKNGYDAFASPENAARAAAQVLKDGLNKNNQDLKAAYGHYSANTNNPSSLDAYYNRAKVGLKKLNDSLQPAEATAFESTSQYKGLPPGATIVANDSNSLPETTPNTQPVQSKPADVGSLDPLNKYSDNYDQINNDFTGTTDAIGGPSDLVNNVVGGIAEPAKPLTASELYTPALETAGMVLGGAAGTLTGPAAPLAIPGGAGVGYAAGKRGAALVDQVRGVAPAPQVTPQQLPQALLSSALSTGKDVAEGTAMDMGGQVAGKVGGAILDKILPSSVAETGLQKLTPEETLKTLQTALKGGKGADAAKEILAAQVKADPELAKIYSRLGVEDLMPIHANTTNQDIADLAAFGTAEKGGLADIEWKKTVDAVKNKSEDALQKLGATKDLESLDSGVKSDIESSIKDVKDAEGMMYKKASPAKDFSAAPDNWTSYINERLSTNNGDINNLTPLEKSVNSKLAPKKVEETIPASTILNSKGEPSIAEQTSTKTLNPTYDMLESELKSVRKARYDVNHEFNTTDDRIRSMVENALAKDQRAFVAQKGDINALNEAHSLTTVRKGLEDDIKNLYGDHLDKSIVPTIKTMVSKGFNGDLSTLNNSLKSLPEEFRQPAMASGILKAVSKKDKFGNIQFDFAKMNETFNGASNNPGVMKTFVNNLGEDGYQTLYDLKTFSKNMLELQDNIAAARSAEGGLVGDIKDQKKTLGAFFSSVGRVISLGFYHVFKAPVSASSVAGTLRNRFGDNTIMQKETAAVLASPEFKEFVGKAAMDGYVSPQVVRKLAGSQNFSDMMKNSSLQERENYINTSIKSLGINSQSKDDKK